MPTEQSSQHCYRCQTFTLHQRPSCSHWLHGILTFLTCFWGIVWMCVAASCQSNKWICQRCGTPAVPDANPFGGGTGLKEEESIGWLIFKLCLLAGLIILFIYAINHQEEVSLFLRSIPKP